MKTIFIGGPLHEQSLEVADKLSDMVHEDESGAQFRYIKRLWSRVQNEQTREIGHSAYFVLASLADQEASTMVIQHIREHGAL